MFHEGTVTHGKATKEQVYPEGLQPKGSIHTGAGEKCEEEGEAGRNCYGLTTVSIPHSSCCGVGGNGIGKAGVRLNLGKRSWRRLFYGFLSLFLIIQICVYLQ